MSRTTKLVSPLLIMNCWKASQSKMFPLLPIFFAKLQAIKASHSWLMVIPRSLDRQYSPGASSSGDDMSTFGFGLILTLNHQASCLSWECKNLARSDCIIFKSWIPNRCFAPANSDFVQWYIAVAVEYNCPKSELAAQLCQMMLVRQSGSPSWKQQNRITKDDAGRWRVQIQRTNKFKSILVLLSETFRKGRFRLFPFSTRSLREKRVLDGFSVCHLNNRSLTENWKVAKQACVKTQ